MKSGDFEVTREVSSRKKREINLKKFIRTGTTEAMNFTNEGEQNKEIDEKVAQMTKVKSLSNEKVLKKNYRLYLLSQGQMFGDEDVLFNRNYSSTVTCRSYGGELYAMKKPDFAKLQNNDETWKKITSKCIKQETMQKKWIKT